MYHKAFNKNKLSVNNTGFYRVSKKKEDKLKKGYRFIYSTNTELLKVNISSTNLYDLRQKVVDNNLLWGILDKEKALETCIDEGINPLCMNSNVNEKYINLKFEENDF